MTRLVISVRNLGEARLAADSGADIVDLKEPARGSLGRVDDIVACEVVNYFSEKKQSLSMAFGELTELNLNRDFTYLRGIQYAKVGLAGSITSNWQAKLKRLQNKLPLGTELAAVHYVDFKSCSAPNFKDILHFAYLHDLPAILIDTFDKSFGGLFDHADCNQVRDFVVACETASIKSVLAGSIDIDQLNEVKTLNPDFVAVRSALCRGNREQNIDKKLLTRFANELKNVEPASTVQMRKADALAY